MEKTERDGGEGNCEGGPVLKRSLKLRVTSIAMYQTTCSASHNPFLLHYPIKMWEISKKRICCYSTSNQLRYHCQIPEKNPHIGMTPPPESFGRVLLGSGENLNITPWLHLPVSFPAYSSVTSYLHTQLKNAMADHVEDWRITKRSRLHSKLFHFLLPCLFKNTYFIYFLTQLL